MDSSSLRFAGDVKIEEIQLNSLNGQVANITNQVISIEIFEDLFAPFTTISLVVRESVDYLNLFPFTGEEFVDVKISTPTLDKGFNGRFYIYKIVDRELTGDREVAYVIKAISEEFITDCNTKISKTYGGAPSETAFKILGKDGLNTKKQVFVEKTSNTTKMTAEFWSPTKVLNYLASASSNSSKSPTYLFYENRDGFNFRSIDELLKGTTYHKYVKDNYTRDSINEGTTQTSQDPNEDYKRILELSIPVLTNYMEDIQSGRMKSRMISHDILTKKYTVKDYSLKRDTEAPPTLLNPYPAYSKYATANSSSTMIIMPKAYANYNNYGDVTNSKVIQRRIAYFQNLQKYKVTIQAFGRTDYTVGQIMELDIPKITQITREDQDIRDKILSGRYLVTAISHVINKKNHTVNIELVKNSVLIDLSTQ